jgi:sulfide:quinone oxidoreductase
VLTEAFDMLHVVPPQRAPRFVRDSELANETGWVAVDEATLQHPRFANVFSLGDACGASNAKTAAAVRKQAPVVAENLCAALENRAPTARYEGYGACPLTVEKGKVVLAEFGYQGKLQPSFPLDPTVPRSSMWWLKRHAMPKIYFELMLKGHEWLARPGKL